MPSLVPGPGLRALAATAGDAAPDGGLVDTLTGFLMLGLAVGIVAALLIAISRRRDLTVSIEQALVAPMAVCSVGAAIVNLWIAFAAFTPWTPPSIVTLLVAAFLMALGAASIRRWPFPDVAAADRTPWAWPEPRLVPELEPRDEAVMVTIGMPKTTNFLVRSPSRCER